MNPPNSFFAGDTVEWEASLSDYPSSLWTLTYTFVNTAGKIEVTAGNDPTNTTYIVTLFASVTAAYMPGTYTWVAKVVDKVTGLETHTVGVGTTTIEQDLSQVGAYDGRSWAEIALENVEAVIANRATKDQESYSIAGRSLSRTPMADLINLRKYLQAEVATRNDILNDGPSTKRAQVRF